MLHRVLSFVLLAVALALFTGSVSAEKKKGDKNTHVGKFVSAKDHEFTMTHKNKEHTHTLAADGKVIGEDGKDCKLADLKAGEMIRVTTMEGDPKTATKVEALKPKAPK